jgi:RNA polymerase sigma factor (sigma-70 family)
MAERQLRAVLDHIRSVAIAQGPDRGDPELLGAFVAGKDQAAFTTLVKRHGPMVLGVCRRVLHQDQDAEDAFQATFLLLAQRGPTIRKPKSLASWLHGVAYRMAYQAKRTASRRHKYESQARPGSSADPLAELLWREVQALLDEAIQSLPLRYRTPFLLCYIEGQGRADVARQLGLKEGTVSSRLARARHLLQERLARRGVALPAVLGLLAVPTQGAKAAVCSTLLASTVQAVALSAGRAAEVVSADVMALVQGAQQAMFLSKCKGAGLLLLCTAVTAAGFGMAATHGPKAETPSRTGPATEARNPKPAVSPETKAKEVVEVRGRVLGPDDKPLAGARLLLFAWSVDKDELKVTATADADGRFRFSVLAGEVRRGAKVAVRARDLGPDWVWIKGGTSANNVTLRLVPDEIPITGRVLDLEGRPVSGASVGVSWVDDVDLKAWLADPKPGDLFRHVTKNFRPAALGVPLSVTTDKDGRFRMTGFGRDRIAHLQIRGAGIENTDIEVMARTGNLHGLRLESRAVYPAGSTIVVRPNKPIVGTVRDKKTGKPIAGISVVHPDATHTWARTRTDDKGHYRLEGVGKRKEYQMVVGELPYFNVTKMNIPDTQGLDPLQVDFELERGIVIRSRLKDEATGKPVQGRVNYGPAPDNPNLKDYAAVTTTIAHTAADGSFAIVAIPGRGHLALTAYDGDAYAVTPQGGIPQYNQVVPIDVPATDEKPIVRDIALKPVKARTGQIIGPDDQPLTGVYAAGLHALLQFDRGIEPLKSASIQIHGFMPKETRVIVMVDIAKRLARVQRVAAGEGEPLTIRLEPTGSLAGRVLDKERRPMPGLKVKASYRILEVDQARRAGRDCRDLPPELLYDYSEWDKIINREATTDKDGRFCIDNLVPGLPYDLAVSDGAAQEIIRRERLTVESGKEKYLGDLR